jgi:hypothetical protein
MYGRALFPLDGARSIYAYTRDAGMDRGGCDVHSRIFTWRMIEEPATGSARATVTALLAELRGAAVRLRILIAVDGVYITFAMVSNAAEVATPGDKTPPLQPLLAR